MASAPCQPSSKRYDCFISCHGDERLADLGFSGRGMEGTVSDLAKEASDRLRDISGRHPSVFYRHSGIGGRISEQIAQALLELRGGGVGLVLLSPGYFRGIYCLAELRAFLELEYLRNDKFRFSEAIEIRFVCLQKEHEHDSVKEAFNGPSLRGFLNGLNPGDVQLHHVSHDAPRDIVVKEICRPVDRYWRDNRSLCLGENQRDCLPYLQWFFETTSPSLIASTLEVNCRDGSTLDTIFSQAVKQDKLTGKNLEDLLRKTDDVNAKGVLRSFRRKWIADGWSWSVIPGRNDFYFELCVDDSNRVLSLVQEAAASTGIALSTTPLTQPSASQPTCSHHHATFRPYFPDVQRLTMGLKANAATSLAQLKAAIFSTNFGDGSPGAYDSGDHESSARLRRVALTSVTGEGGVGKTSTCKLLCADEGVRKHFAGGALLWIDVGQGATEEEVKGQVRGAMRKCGGKDEAKEICADTSIGLAVDIASDFFSEHRILVVIDNVWETPASSSFLSWAATLSKIARCPGSVIIMTTRSSSLSEGSGFDPIRLGRLDLENGNSPDWGIAEQMYDALLQATPEEQSSEDYKKHRRKGLGLSCGLLLGIGTFARLVRNRMRIGGNVQSLLDSIDDKVLGLAGRFVGKELGAVIGHHGLFAAMEESLAHLDEYKGDCVKLAPLAELRDGEGKDVRQFRASYEMFHKPLSSRYAALEVMVESSTRLSFPILRRLWHVATVAEAGEIALLFVNIGLGCIEGGRAGQEKELVLHDLQYEFCVSISKGSAMSVAGAGGGIPWSVNGHAVFLSSCESLVSSGVAPGDSCSGWASFCFQGLPGLDRCELRRHVAQNLFRHLFAAAAQETCGALLTMLCSLAKFQWIRGRISAHGRNAILTDCSYALKSLERARPGAEARSSDTSGGYLPFVRSLQVCLMVAAEGVSMKSDGSLAGSLCQLAQSFAGSEGAFAGEACIAKRLAISAERHVRGPWLKPVSGCPRAFSSDQGTIAMAIVGDRCGVQCVAALGDAMHVISGCEDGVVRVHECMYLRTELELVGHSGLIRCVAAATKKVGESAFRVFSGGEDSFVRFWDVHVLPEGVVGKVGSGIVGNCEGSMQSLSVNSSGARVAGCSIRSVFVWKKAGAGEMSSYTVLAKFASTSYEFGDLAISKSGELIVANEVGGKVFVWNEQDSLEDRAWENILVSDKTKNWLRFISLSEDEKYLLCVSGDAAVEIWNLQARSCRSIALPQWFRVKAMICTGSEFTTAGGGGSSWRFIVCGEGEDYNKVAVEYCLGETLEVSSRYRIPSRFSISICLAPPAGSRRVIAGGYDGMCKVEASGVAGSDGDEVQTGRRSRDDVRRQPSPNNSYGEVMCVAVLPVSGRVVAGHESGDLSLWMMNDGKFERVIKAVKNSAVLCLDVSDDESVAVSGHWGGFALVWDTATWRWLFSLKGRSDPVVCVTISADNTRIVTVDGSGKLRFWDMVKLARLAAVKCGSQFCSFRTIRGAISRDGKYFLWASKAFGMWKANLIDLAAERVNYTFDEEESNWCAVLKKANQRAGSAEAEKEVQWRFGAVERNWLVDLAAEPRHQQDSWEVKIGRRSQEAREGERRRATVACVLSNRARKASEKEYLEIVALMVNAGEGAEVGTPAGGVTVQCTWPICGLACRITRACISKLC